jgi:molybdenum cofactor cytidylyltransferase
MAAAFWAGPELVGRPRHSGARIAHFHLRAAALTTNVAIDVGHQRILASYDPAVIPAIVLAAGKSSRMGRVKANLPVSRTIPGDPAMRDTFLTRIVKTLHEADIADVIVVVGHEREAVIARFAESGLSARFVENVDYESGQLSSLLKGLRMVDRPGVAAALVTLVDVPFVSALTVRAVVDRYRQTLAPIVRPFRAGRHGHPLLIDRSLFDQLRHADSVAGAKPVVRSNATPAGDVEVEDEGAFRDIDTPEEYEEALSVFGSGARGASAAPR